MPDAGAAWAALDHAWRACLDEAWESWRNGCAGVGAVLTDPRGTIVARGRNRMLETPTEPGVIAGCRLAHAEMNALAALPMGDDGGLTITTSFEPCLMCASTILLYRIERVRYAAADPLFDGMHDWFGQLPFAAERLPEREALRGPVGAFAHVLHLSWLAFWMSDSPVIDAHGRLAPQHLVLATDLIRSGALTKVAESGGSTLEALGALWDRLVEIDPG